MKPPARSTWFLWPLILIPAAGAAALLLYPKLLSGDYAKITIESVTPTRPGEVEIRYRGRLSAGTVLQEVSVAGDSTSIVWLKTAASRFPRRPEPLEAREDEPRVLVVYSIRDDQGRPASSEEVLRRILVIPGRTHVVRRGRHLPVFRYVASDGVRTEKYLQVLPADR